MKARRHNLGFQKYLGTSVSCVLTSVKVTAHLQSFTRERSTSHTEPHTSQPAPQGLTGMIRFSALEKSSVIQTTHVSSFTTYL